MSILKYSFCSEENLQHRRASFSFVLMAAKKIALGSGGDGFCDLPNFPSVSDFSTVVLDSSMPFVSITASARAVFSMCFSASELISIA